MWSSRGGDVIHWYAHPGAERSACGVLMTTLPHGVHIVHCQPCMRIACAIPPVLDEQSIEAWLAS